MDRRQELLAEHAALTAQLADAHEALSHHRAAEHQTRIQAFTASMGDSISARDRDASIASSPFTYEALKLEGLVRAFDARLTDIRVQLEHDPTHIAHMLRAHGNV